MVRAMNHLPSSIRAAMPKFPVDGTEAEQDAWFEALPPCPSIPSVDDESDEEVAAADARALADLAAGRVYSHAIVSEWLETWGTSDRRSFKEWLNARNG